jgi:copper(I)-binding protein
VTTTVTSRRSLAVRGVPAVLALALGLPAVAGCAAGQNTVTERERTTPFAQGVDLGAIHVRAMRVVSAGVVTTSGATLGANAGTQGYLTMTVTNEGQRPDTLTNVSLVQGGQVTPSGTGSVTVQPQHVLVLGLPTGSGGAPTLKISGASKPLVPGTIVTLRLSFQNAGDTTVSVPVVDRAEAGTTATASPPDTSAGNRSPTPGVEQSYG